MAGGGGGCAVLRVDVIFSKLQSRYDPHANFVSGSQGNCDESLTAA